MNFLQRVTHMIDAATECLGKTIAWLAIAMMIVMTLTVLLRYGLNIGSVFMQELVMYMHAALFLLASGFTLKHDGHVRVDIFYRRLSDYAKAWVNLCGTVFLLVPVMVFIAWSSWEYVMTAWRIQEVSSEPGGIPAVFILKSFIPLMSVLLLLQAAAEACRALLTVLNKAPLPTAKHEDVL